MDVKPGEHNRELRKAETTRAWHAVIAEGRAGLAVDTTYPLLDHFNCYLSAGSHAAINAMLRKVPLKNNVKKSRGLFADGIG